MFNERLFSHSTHLFRHHVPTEFVLLGIIEFIVLVSCFYVSVEMRFSDHNAPVLHSTFSNAVLFAIAVQLGMLAFGIYQRQSTHSISLLVVRISASLVAGVIFLSILYYFVPVLFMGRGVLAISVATAFVSIIAIRLLFSRYAKMFDFRLRVLVLGAGERSNLVKDVIKDLPALNILHYMPMQGDKEYYGDAGAKSPGEVLVNYVEIHKVDVIVLAMDERRKGLPVYELLDCKMGGIEVLDLPTFFERYTSKINLDVINPSWLFHSDGFQVNLFRRGLKRTTDMVFVLFALPFVLPVSALVAAAIVIESGFRGSVLYSQDRVTENSKIFKIYKFRSMVSGAEKDGIARWAVKNDSRITRVGSFLRKFRLDELPQLYNVLKGDMSFVGPRPERPEFVERLSRNIPYYKERHRVKPGLTGWAQIRYPYGASEEDGKEKLQYDLYYVKNYSLLLDALVMLQTMEVVLLGKGAH